MAKEDKLYTGAQMVMESFLREGVDTIFGLPGGANLPLYDVLENGGVGIRPVPEGVEPKEYPIKHYLVRHEQCAAHAADAYARVSGKAGVCCGTSGPGATNLVTGIANAWMDSVPLVCITGQVVSCADRPRRLPGSRHHRHHDPDHEAQRARPRRRGHRAGDARGLPHRHDRPARPGARRHPARRPAADRRVRLPGQGRRCAATSRHERRDPDELAKRRRADRRSPSARSSSPATASSSRAPAPSCVSWPRRRTSR